MTSPSTTALPMLVIDAANVVGSTPDGWWRDRAGAATRLRDRLADVATSGVPQLLDAPLEVVMIVEGQARGIGSSSTVRVVDADGSGDDQIVAVVAARSTGRRCIVVTADRGLRARVQSLGAEVVGPSRVSGG